MNYFNRMIFTLLTLSFCLAHSWEDHPDREDHKETDRLFKQIQKLTKANELEKLIGSPKEEIVEFCEKNHINYEEIKDVIR